MTVQGHFDEALTHFRRAAEINPRNLDAARRVRLAEMRARASQAPETPPEDDPGNGFLSKLFARKK